MEITSPGVSGEARGQAGAPLDLDAPGARGELADVPGVKSVDISGEGSGNVW